MKMFIRKIITSHRIYVCLVVVGEQEIYLYLLKTKGGFKYLFSSLDYTNASLGKYFYIFLIAKL